MVFFHFILFTYIASVTIKVVSKLFTETLGVSFSLAALLDCIRRHHRHSVNLVSGVVSAARWPHAEPPHQHHLLHLRHLHPAASCIRR